MKGTRLHSDSLLHTNEPPQISFATSNGGRVSSDGPLYANSSSHYDSVPEEQSYKLHIRDHNAFSSEACQRQSGDKNNSREDTVFNEEGYRYNFRGGPEIAYNNAPAVVPQAHSQRAPVTSVRNLKGKDSFSYFGGEEASANGPLRADSSSNLEIPITDVDDKSSNVIIPKSNDNYDRNSRTSFPSDMANDTIASPMSDTAPIPPKHFRKRSASYSNTESTLRSHGVQQQSNLKQMGDSDTRSKDQRFVRYAMNTRQQNNKYSGTPWNMIHVLKWLETHNFNESWRETFKRNEISGNRFLELGNYESNSAIWNQFSKFLITDDTLNSVNRFIDLVKQENTYYQSSQGAGRNSPLNEFLSTPSKSEQRKSTPIFSKHRSSSSTASSSSSGSVKEQPRPHSYVESTGYKAFTKDSSHKIFRKHNRSSSENVSLRHQSAPTNNQTPAGSFNLSQDLRHRAKHNSSYDESLAEPRGKYHKESKNLNTNNSYYKGGEHRKSGMFIYNLMKYGGDKAVGIVKQMHTPGGNRNQYPKTPSSANSISDSLKDKTIVPFEGKMDYTENMLTSFGGHIGEKELLSEYSLASTSQTSLDNEKLSPNSSFEPRRFDPEYKASGSALTLDEESSIDAMYLPKKIFAADKISALVTKDNYMFVSVSFTNDDLNDFELTKNVIIQGLNLVNVGNFSFHLIDLNSNEGAALPSETLLQILRLQTSWSILVRQELNSPTGTIMSTASSDSKSFEIRGDSEEKAYPATPQYLLQSSNDAKMDYWNFKEISNTDKLKRINEGEPLKKEKESARIPHEAVEHGDKFQLPLSQQSDKHFVLNHSVPQNKLRKKGAKFSPETKGRPASVDKSDNIRIQRERTRSTAVGGAKPQPRREDAGLERANSLISTGSSAKSHTSRSNSDKLSSIVAKRAAPPPPPLSNRGSFNKENIISKQKGSFSRQSLSKRNSNTEKKKPSDNTENSMDGSTYYSSYDSNAVSSDDDFFVKPLGVSKDDNVETSKEELMKGFSDDASSDEEFFMKPLNRSAVDVPSSSASTNKMQVRPPVEEVFNNLEKYFPNTNLDKPIIDDSPVSPVDMKAELHDKDVPRKLSIARTVSNANISPVSTKPVVGEDIFYGDSSGSQLKRKMKTIRIVANEARQKRLAKRKAPEFKNDRFHTSNNGTSNEMRRKNTKMWGQRVVEVTPVEIERGIVSKLRNRNGICEEFAWIKGKLIGRGSFGAVYLGLNVTTGEMLAVKQVVVRTPGDQTEGIEALNKEMETIKNLDHDNIVQYLGFEQKKNTYSLFLEYVAGGSIASCMKTFGRLEESLIKFITRQVLLGLEYLHSNKILHRDLKADNLLLEVDGTCKISDFGISKRSQDIYANNAEMSMQGTVFWMAPEVIDSIVEDKKQGYSAKVDIWSLGCVVLEMFAGKRPWSNEAVVSAIYKIGKTKLAPPIPEDISVIISDDGRDFIEKCFIINPEERPTASDLLGHPFTKIDSNFNFKETKLWKTTMGNRRKV